MKINKPNVLWVSFAFSVIAGLLRMIYPDFPAN